MVLKKNTYKTNMVGCGQKGTPFFLGTKFTKMSYCHLKLVILILSKVFGDQKKKKKIRLEFGYFSDIIQNAGLFNAPHTEY